MDSNQWIFLNSPKLYSILSTEQDSNWSWPFNEDIKMLHHYWVLRNERMAQHIDEVARQFPNKRIVVFFGAGHVGPVRKMLNKLNKNFQVLTLLDVMK